jgi:Flp pilus assembly protein TadD
MRAAQQRGDRKALVELARLEEMAAQPAQTVGYLGELLMATGAWTEAAAFFWKARRRHPQDFWINFNLAFCLDKSQLPQPDQAIRFYTAAVALNPGNVMAHSNLGGALSAKGRLDEAISEFREAIRLKKDYAEAHYNLANVLRQRGQLDEANAEFNEALQIDPDFAEAHINLGLTLWQQGEFRKALAELRRGSASTRPLRGWQGPHAPAELIKICERLVKREAHLHTILAGKETPASAGEWVELAQLCQPKRLYRAAARFYKEAFVAQPSLTNDLNSHRYNAACAAALAGCGQGKDAAKPDSQERARLLHRALDWLQADLKAWGRLLDRGPNRAQSAAGVASVLQHWLVDPDLAGVRGPEALARLPEAERQPWRKLWADVAATRPEPGRRRLPRRSRPPGSAPRIGPGNEFSRRRMASEVSPRRSVCAPRDGDSCNRAQTSTITRRQSHAVLYLATKADRPQPAPQRRADAPAGAALPAAAGSTGRPLPALHAVRQQPPG